jgi:Ca-activated chloride channel family protein
MHIRALPPIAVLTALLLLAGLLSTGWKQAVAQQPDVTTPVPPRPAPPLPPPTPVKLDRMNVNVLVQDQLARTTVDLVFANPSSRPAEATLLFPLPPGAAVTDLTLTVDGMTFEGEILGREEAARIYTQIVRSLRDPALLEYVGSDVVRAHVFPVPPAGESRLTLRFSHLLRAENGALRYRLPLSVGTDVGPAVSRLAINVRAVNTRGVSALFSPTHAMRFDRVAASEMTAVHEAAGVPLRGAFELAVLPAGEEVPAGLIAYRTPGQDGFFMLWLSPPLREEAVVDKDVVLVLDTSGSMAGVKIEQAKAALRFVLNRLNPGDRFTIVDFSSSVRSLGPTPGLRPAGEAAAGLAYVDRLVAEGGTNINEALLTALSLADRERPTTMIFLTDGLPTVGVTDRNSILANVRAGAPQNVRLFAFGVGNDVDTTLLDGLATQNHGDVVYVEPREDVEEKVSTLYRRIGAPQLTDVRLEVEGSDTYDVYPEPLPDLFGGQTLYVFGRYRTPGSATIRLSGRSRTGDQSFAYEGMTLPSDDRDASYLPYLWASRKVAALLREIRLQGPERSRELVDEVVALSTRYGIVTPYTAFLVQEPGAVTADAARTAVARAAEAPSTGAGATTAAAQTGQLAAAAPAPRPTAVPAAVPVPQATTVPGAPAPPPAPSPAAAVEQRFVGDRSFVLRDGVWVDTAYQRGMETIKVSFGSEAYFALLAEKPGLAPFFALGERLIVVYEGVAYEVTA